MGNLHAVGVQLLDEGDHLFEMVEILAVDHQVYGERDFVAANRAREFDFVRVRFGAGNPVGGIFTRILEAELNVIETSGHQRRESLLIQSDSRGNQVGVESGCAGCGDEFGQVLTR